ncbi:hypothetical protein JX265_011432 [Neoarthrinium moseri]|uniref:Heterokaryon incompatibility domain-containing protein n=1 Tax=Neoarthrinium moseri TaxID=1658444 RepID=A0A9P9WC95_9PEZI|nr:hypothetical protein JX265_011432 [Neoarthrinium moseri]
MASQSLDSPTAMDVAIPAQGVRIWFSIRQQRIKKSFNELNTHSFRSGRKDRASDTRNTDTLGKDIREAQSPQRVQQSFDQDQASSPMPPIFCSEHSDWNVANHFFRVMTQDVQAFELRPLEHIISKSPICTACSIISSAVLSKLSEMGQDAQIAGLQIYVGSAFFVQKHDPYDEFATHRENYELHAFRDGQRATCVLYVDIHDPVADGPYLLLKSKGYWLAPKVPIPLTVSYSGSEGLTYLGLWEENASFDVDLIKEWVRTCERHHVQCRKPPAELPDGCRLIDIEKMCVTEAPKSARFVALSYVWKKVHISDKHLQLCSANLMALHQPGGVKLEQLPALIGDTIWLCRQLDERYIWVDKLCIVQDDAKSLHAQVCAMDIIYGMAAFTLVAASDDAHFGLRGVPHRPRHSFLRNDTRLFKAGLQKLDINYHVTVDGSEWNTRGWTFQERLLSPRCLIVTRYQVYFSCAEVIFQEDLGGMLQRSERQNGMRNRNAISNVNQVDTLQAYRTCVSDYTSRKLSYEKDRAHAFAGVSHALSGMLNSPVLFGLPVSYFLQSLLWESSGPSGRIQLAEEPSWSWTAWSGRVVYKNTKSEIKSLNGLYIAGPDNNLREIVSEPWHPVDTPYGLLRTSLEARIHVECDGTDPALLLLDQIEARRGPSIKIVAPQPSVPLNCLRFSTTAASLRLGVRPRDQRTTTRILDLYSRETRVGWMEIDDNTAIDLDLNETHTFIAICAVKTRQKPANRMASTRQRLMGTFAENQNGLNDNRVLLMNHDHAEWTLRVMLIEEVGGIAYRVALGSVGEQAWVDAGPKLRTIILG